MLPTGHSQLRTRRVERQIPICAATILGGKDQKQKERRVSASKVVCFETSLTYICTKLQQKLNLKNLQNDNETSYQNK